MLSRPRERLNRGVSRMGEAEPPDVAEYSVDPSPQLLHDLEQNGPLLLKHSDAVPVPSDDPSCKCWLALGGPGDLRSNICEEHQDQAEEVQQWVLAYIEHESERRAGDAYREVQDLRRQANRLVQEIGMQLEEWVGPLQAERDRLQDLLEAWPGDVPELEVEVFGATVEGAPQDLRPVVERARDRVSQRLAVQETQVSQLQQRHQSLLNRVRELQHPDRYGDPAPLDETDEQMARDTVERIDEHLEKAGLKETEEE